MRAAIETGVGLTAAKLMVGKAVAKSDETYIAKAKLKGGFIKLSKYLNVTGVEEAEKPLQKIIVQQEQEITILRERMRVILRRMREQENEMAKLKTLVGDMGETLRDMKKATTLWQKAEKMGFMGIESEGDTRESKE